jgi:pimeloyl-ACP methyl ester carboxylesterase
MIGPFDDKGRFPAMRHFNSDGIDIAYLDAAAREGAGEPILLIHGFASNSRLNWVGTGWVAALSHAGRRVVAYDNRGHGDSEKLYDPACYAAPTMAEDARRLLDRLQIDRADVMGYSMGARIAAFLALRHPERVRRLVFGGLGIAMVRGVGDPEPVARALEAARLEDVVDPRARAFRKFADQSRSDLRALAACIRSARRRITEEEIATLPHPILVAVGGKDEIAGSPQELAALIGNAEVLPIPRRDHMTATGDRVFKEGVLEFLARRP